MGHEREKGVVRIEKLLIVGFLLATCTRERERERASLSLSLAPAGILINEIPPRARADNSNAAGHFFAGAGYIYYSIYSRRTCSKFIVEERQNRGIINFSLYFQTEKKKSI